jgi:hypothetical protein
VFFKYLPRFSLISQNMILWLYAFLVNGRQYYS